MKKTQTSTRENARGRPPLYYLGSFADLQGICEAPGCGRSGGVVAYLSQGKIIAIHICGGHMKNVENWGTPAVHPFLYEKDVSYIPRMRGRMRAPGRSLCKANRDD